MVVTARALPAWVFGSLVAASSAGACRSDEFSASEAAAGEAGQGGASSGGSAGSDAGEGGEAGQGAEGGTDPRGGAGGAGTQGGSGGSAGADTGGSATGGMGGGGAGRAGAGGVVGVGGLAGAGGSGNAGFPSFGILDDFNREGPELGLDWVGATGAYDIVEQSLRCGEYYCPGLFWAEPFGATQEVFATLAAFYDSSPEINLVLKAQGDVDCDLLEVLYSPLRGGIDIDACWDGTWRTLGSFDVVFEPGDQLGGRAHPDGKIEVFQNGVLLTVFDAGEYPYIAGEGRIGVNGVVDVDSDASANAWDDFGGGGR